MIRHPGRHSRKSRISLIEALEPRQLLSSAPAVVTPPFDPTMDGFTPAQIRHAYGFDQLTFGNGTIPADGRGQTIALVDAQDDPTVMSDLNVFDTQFGIAAPPSFKVVDQTGGNNLPAPDPGWASEITLDVEWAHAMAPMANILLVETNTQDFPNLVAGVDYARHQPGVSVISMSWGGNEFFQWNGGEGEQTQFDPVFTTPAGHQPITFIAAAGDHTAQAGVLWPAADPNVLTVGGTSLTTADSSGTYKNETYWTGTNSGYSNLETEPQYQEEVQHTGYRSSPDVTYNADPKTGFAVYSDFAFNGWLPGGIGGTSAGSPQWASLIALVNQDRALKGSASLDGPTQTIPLLYSLYSPPLSSGYSTYTSFFNDVNQVNSPIIGNGSTTFNDGIPTAGFDTATGLGSPKVQTLVPALATLSAPPTSTIVATVVKGPPAAVRGGDRGFVKLLLTNKAATAFDEPVSVNLYAVPASGAPGQTLVGTIALPAINLKAGHSKVVRLNFTYPATINGKFKLLSYIVTPLRDNTPTQVTTATPFSIAAPVVDLAAIVAKNTSVVVHPGLPGTAEITVQNWGNTTADGTVTLNLYASATKVIDANATLLPASTTRRIHLRPGGTIKLHIRFYAPTNRAAGSYSLLASITSNTDPADTNLADNVAVIGTRAS